jgi:hypothetical protein
LEASVWAAEVDESLAALLEVIRLAEEADPEGLAGATARAVAAHPPFASLLLQARRGEQRVLGGRLAAAWRSVFLRSAPARTRALGIANTGPGAPAAFIAFPSLPALRLAPEAFRHGLRRRLSIDLPQLLPFAGKPCPLCGGILDLKGDHIYTCHKLGKSAAHEACKFALSAALRGICDVRTRIEPPLQPLGISTPTAGARLDVMATFWTLEPSPEDDAALFDGRGRALGPLRGGMQRLISHEILVDLTIVSAVSGLGRVAAMAAAAGGLDSAEGVIVGSVAELWSPAQVLKRRTYYPNQERPAWEPFEYVLAQGTHFGRWNSETSDFFSLAASAVSVRDGGLPAGQDVDVDSDSLDDRGGTASVSQRVFLLWCWLGVALVKGSEEALVRALRSLRCAAAEGAAVGEQPAAADEQPAAAGAAPGFGPGGREASGRGAGGRRTSPGVAHSGGGPRGARGAASAAGGASDSQRNIGSRRGRP